MYMAQHTKWGCHEKPLCTPDVHLAYCVLLGPKPYLLYLTSGAGWIPTENNGSFMLDLGVGLRKDEVGTKSVELPVVKPRCGTSSHVRRPTPWYIRDIEGHRVIPSWPLMPVNDCIIRVIHFSFRFDSAISQPLTPCILLQPPA